MTRNVGGLLSLAAVLTLGGCSGGDESPTPEASLTAAKPAPETAPETAPPAAMATAPGPDISAVAPDRPLTAKQMLAVDRRDAGAEPLDPAALARTADGRTPPDGTVISASTLTVEPARLDLGDVSTNKYATGSVRLVNNGAKAITIQDCKTSCGCTSTNCPKGKELQPGESADVDIRVTAGTRQRKISKTVTFRVVDQQPVILPVSVQVIAYVVIAPETIDPEQVTDGGLVIKATDEQPFRITSMSPPILEEFSDQESISHELNLDWDTWRDLGQSRRIVFNVDHPEASQVSVVVRANSVRRAEARPDVQSPIRDTADRLREQGVVDAQLTTPEPPAKAAIAVKYGNVEEIQKILADGLEESQRNDLLGMAAKYGRVDVMGALLAGGASPTATDKRGRTPLMSAVQSRNAEAVRYLIENGAEVNARDVLQGTALLRAAGTFGDAETVQVLLSAGAEVNTQDKNGMTPLMWAARWGDASRVEVLVKAGAKVAARDKNGRTALDWARARGEKAADTVEILQPLTESEAKSGDSGDEPT
ncbi:MAG: ankyrin repeat domain-containing protein [Planctomycetota bacterium]